MNVGDFYDVLLLCQRSTEHLLKHRRASHQYSTQSVDRNRFLPTIQAERQYTCKYKLENMLAIIQFSRDINLLIYRRVRIVLYVWSKNIYRLVWFRSKTHSVGILNVVHASHNRKYAPIYIYIFSLSISMKLT